MMVKGTVQLHRHLNRKACAPASRKGLLCWAEPFGFGPSAALNLFASSLPEPRTFAGTAFTCDLQGSHAFPRMLHCDNVQSTEGAQRFTELCKSHENPSYNSLPSS